MPTGLWRVREGKRLAVYQVEAREMSERGTQPAEVRA
jgi:hypothetical protein